MEANEVKGLMKEAVKGLLTEKPNDPRAWLADYFIFERNSAAYRKLFVNTHADDIPAAEKPAFFIEKCGPFYADEVEWSANGTSGPSGKGSVVDMLKSITTLYAGAITKGNPTLGGIFRGRTPDEILVKILRNCAASDESGNEVEGTDFKTEEGQMLTFNSDGKICKYTSFFPTGLYDAARAGDKATLTNMNRYMKLFWAGQKMLLPGADSPTYLKELGSAHAPEFDYDLKTFDVDGVETGSAGKGSITDFLTALAPHSKQSKMLNDGGVIMSITKGSSSDEILVRIARKIVLTDDSGAEIDGPVSRMDDTQTVKWNEEGLISSFVRVQKYATKL